MTKGLQINVLSEEFSVCKIADYYHKSGLDEGKLGITQVEVTELPSNGIDWPQQNVI